MCPNIKMNQSKSMSIDYYFFQPLILSYWQAGIYAQTLLPGSLI